jgi:phosphotriesterase-related protein
MLALITSCQVLAVGAPSVPEPGTAVGMVQTVTGPIEPAALGLTLSHEHVLVDFVGADKVSPDRYDPDEVFEVMLPYLAELRETGVSALVECTPDYLGRDPVLLRRLSEASGVRILTNTGYYKDPFLPAWVRDADAERIAERWTQEAVSGIGPERIKPGFIKIAASEGSLNETQRKIVRAAALTSRATGLAIASHTTTASVALEELDVLAAEGVPGSRFIVVHADADPNAEIHAAIARLGAWLSYDGIRAENAAAKATLVREALSRWPDQLLISQDAGWYNVGQPRGGSIVPWSWLPREFVPMLTQSGVAPEAVERLLKANPARAFTIRPPTGGLGK